MHFTFAFVRAQTLSGSDTLRFGELKDNFYTNQAKINFNTNFKDSYIPLTKQRRFHKWIDATKIPVEDLTIMNTRQGSRLKVSTVETRLMMATTTRCSWLD